MNKVFRLSDCKTFLINHNNVSENWIVNPLPKNDFLLQIGASIIVIHEKGAIHKDNRFQLFDKIIEIDGKKISSETSENDLKKTFQHCYGKVYKIRILPFLLATLVMISWKFKIDPPNWHRKWNKSQYCCS